MSKSGYYDSRGREASPRAVRRERIKAVVARLHDASHCVYGSVKIAKAMQQDERLESACRNTVARAMRAKYKSLG